MGNSATQNKELQLYPPSTSPASPDDEGTLQVRSHEFKEDGLCDDYNRFTQALLYVLKLPLPNANSPDEFEERQRQLKQCELVEFECVSGSADFTVNLTLDGAKAGLIEDKIVREHSVLFDPDARTMLINIYEDRSVNAQPRRKFECYFEFGDPLFLTSWYIDEKGKRHADTWFRPLVDAAFDELKSRKALLRWDHIKCRAFTGELDSYTCFDALFSDLEKGLRKSAESIPGTIWITRDVRCKFAPGSASQTWTHIFDRGHGTLSVQASEPLDGWPILEMRLHRKPLHLEVWFMEVDGTRPSSTGYLPMKGIQSDILDRIFPLDGKPEEDQTRASWSSWLPQCQSCGTRRDRRTPSIVMDPTAL